MSPAYRRPISTLIAATVVLIIFYFWYVEGFTFSPPQFPYADSQTLTWENRAPLLTARSEIGAALLSDEIYVVGGLDGLARSLTTVERYSIAHDRWETVASLPEPVNHTMVAAHDKTVYVFGGFDPLGLQFKFRGLLVSKFRATDAVYAYDPAADQWSEKQRLPIALGAGAAVTHGDKIYLFGGIDRTERDSQRTLIYDPKTDSYTEGQPMRSARDHLTAQAIGSRIYVVGGRTDSLVHNMDTVEVYNPATDSWTEAPPMPRARGGIASGVIDDRLYIFGGESSNDVFPEVDVFDTVSQTWGEAGTMPTARHGLGAVSHQDRVYVLAGGKHPRISRTDLNEMFYTNK